MCCADFDYSHIMGNAFEAGGFRAVWNNTSYCAFRAQVLRDIAAIDICRRCGVKNFADGFVRE